MNKVDASKACDAYRLWTVERDRPPPLPRINFDHQVSGVAQLRRLLTNEELHQLMINFDHPKALDNA